MSKNKLFLISFVLLLSGCAAQQSQIDEFGWHSTSSVRIQTDDQVEKFYDDPLYYYHNEFDWLYLN